jgi:hypothetical protein
MVRRKISRNRSPSASLGTEAMDIATIAQEWRRLPPGKRKRYLNALSPEQRTALGEFMEPALRPTPEEERFRQAAWQLADAATWQTVAASNIIHVVESYRRGHVSFNEAMTGVHRISVGCWSNGRVQLLGLTALYLLQISPEGKKRGQRRPTWPLWIQNSTADLVLSRQSETPKARRSPRHQDVVQQPADQSSPSIEWALGVFKSLGWFGGAGVPTPGTVDDWVRARLKEQKSPSE